MIASLFVLLGLACHAQQTPVRVLFLVGGGSHDYDKAPRILLEDLQRKLNGRLQLDVKLSQDLGLFRADELGRTDLLMLNLCQQTELAPEQKQSLLEAVRRGLPVVALHCTFWCFQTWPEFRRMLGAFVPGHAKFGPMCVRPVKDAGAIASGLPVQFELTDEPYLVNDRDPSIHAVVETCNSYNGRPGSEPEAWTKSYGKGRVFAMTFGHNLQSQQDANYLTLLSNGILWALGRKE